MGPSGGRWAGRLLAAGWGAVGASMVVSAVDVLRSGWAPVIDNALVAALTVDSLSLDPPLVGMPTSLGLEDGAPLSHPGPLGFWVLAIPTKVLGEPGDGLVLGSVVLALACLAGIALLLRRRADAPLESIGLVLVGAMVVSMGGQTFASPFNPYIGILPLLLCAIAAWGVLEGRHRQVWIVVLAGSVAAQTHLGYVPLVAALLVVTTVSVVVEVARSSGPRRRRLTRRIIPMGVVLGVMAWTGPLVDQLVGSHNLSRLVGNQTADRPTTGIGHGVDVAVEMTSLPPRWLLGRARDQDLGDPSAIRVALGVVAVTVVVALLVRAVRRRDRAVASLTAVSLVLVAAATVTSARVVDPTATPFFAVERAVLYRLFWWPVGVVFALALLWGSFAEVVAALGARGRPALAARLRAPVVAAVAAGVAVMAWIGYAAPTEGLARYFDRESANAAAIADLAGPGPVVLRFSAVGVAGAPARRPADLPPDVWDLGPHQRYGHAMNLVAQLRLRGIAVRFAEEPDDGIVFMHAYREAHPARGGEPAVLYLVGPAVHGDPPPGYRRLAAAGAAPGEPFDALTVPSAVYVPSS